MGACAVGHNQSHRFVIRPNGAVRSGSMMYAGCFAFGAGGFSVATLGYLGLWPIGVWMLVTMVVLGAVLCVIRVRNNWRQIISIRGNQVIIETGQRRQPQREVFTRGWVRLEWRHPDSRNYASRLFLRSHGRAIEIGPCLTVSERDALAQRLLLSLPAVTST